MRLAKTGKFYCTQIFSQTLLVGVQIGPTFLEDRLAGSIQMLNAFKLNPAFSQLRLYPAEILGHTQMCIPMCTAACL